MSQTNKSSLVYHESSGEQKFKGWHYCSFRHAFFRWEEYIQGIKIYQTAFKYGSTMK